MSFVSFTVFADRAMTVVRSVANLEGAEAERALSGIRRELGNRDPREGEYVTGLAIRVDRIGSETYAEAAE